MSVKPKIDDKTQPEFLFYRTNSENGTGGISGLLDVLTDFLRKVSKKRLINMVQISRNTSTARSNLKYGVIFKVATVSQKEHFFSLKNLINNHVARQRVCYHIKGKNNLKCMEMQQ